jgi:catechol 2,3-dioxygenase-like lactoylglutathione lyase family enzyme
MSTDRENMTEKTTDAGFVGLALFCRNLSASREFYQSLLGLQVAAIAPEAALLTASRDGGEFLLRELGPHAQHPLGAIGLHFSCWAVPDGLEFARARRWLAARGALVDEYSGDGWRILRARDPDGLTVLLRHQPDPRRRLPRSVPPQLYGLD